MNAFLFQFYNKPPSLAYMAFYLTKLAHNTLIQSVMTLSVKTDKTLQGSKVG